MMRLFLKNFKLYSQKAAMFGLDARIVLAILAVTSLSIALIEEGQSKKELDFYTKQKLRMYKSEILKNLHNLRMKGYDAQRYVYGQLLDNTSSYDGVEKILSISVDKYIPTPTASTQYNRTINNTSYQTSLVQCSSKMLRSAYFVATNFYDNFKTGQYQIGASSYQSQKAQDICYRLQKTFESLQFNLSSKDIIPVSMVANGHQNYLQLGLDSYNKPIGVHILVEHNVNQFTKADYIIHFILYSMGANLTLDTALPTNLEQLDNLKTLSKNDDIIEVFSTKYIYTKAKITNNDILQEIANKINEKAESSYLSLVSDCVNNHASHAICDDNNDSVYSQEDLNKINEINFYYKSNLDTSSAVYHNTSHNYIYNLTSPKSFVVNSLGLPGYYYVDLFGNVLGYNSNVEKLNTGPYTMEVWY